MCKAYVWVAISQGISLKRCRGEYAVPHVSTGWIVHKRMGFIAHDEQTRKTISGGYLWQGTSRILAKSKRLRMRI